MLAPMKAAGTEYRLANRMLVVSPVWWEARVQAQRSADAYRAAPSGAFFVRHVDPARGLSIASVPQAHKPVSAAIETIFAGALQSAIGPEYAPQQPGTASVTRHIPEKHMV
jgi:hypothetical protein